MAKVVIYYNRSVQGMWDIIVIMGDSDPQNMIRQCRTEVPTSEKIVRALPVLPLYKAACSHTFFCLCYELGQKNDEPLHQLNPMVPIELGPLNDPTVVRPR